jgi:PAS domain S-box-containing protein
LKDDEDKLNQFEVKGKSLTLKLAEEYLKIKYELTEILNFLPDPTFILNHEEKVVVWNPAMEEITYIKAEDMIGKYSYEYSIPFYEEKIPNLAEILINPHEENENQFIHFEKIKNTITAEVFLPQLSSEGKYFWIKARRLYGLHGEIIGAIETIRDITKYKITEQKLEELEKSKNK